MKKVGEGTIPMPYPMWKEMHDRVENSREAYKTMKDILEIHKNVSESPELGEEESQKVRIQHVAMAMQLEQCEGMLEEMEESFKKYYSFEP